MRGGVESVADLGEGGPADVVRDAIDALRDEGE